MNEAGIRPVDALGHADYKAAPAPMSFGDMFTPTYRVFMPEYYLTGIQTETLMRDLSPIQTLVRVRRMGRVPIRPVPRRRRCGSQRTT